MEVLVSKDYGSKPWVARLVGLDRKYGFAREFVAPVEKDLSRSGATGTYVYLLGDGVYEIASSHVTAGGQYWRKQDRLFLLIRENDVQRVDRDQVIQILRSK